MKLISSLLTVLIGMSCSAFALSGGPYANDSADNSDGDGFHVAVIRGKNLTGVIQAPVGVSAAGVAGVFAVNSAGNVASGQALLAVDNAGRKVTGVLDGRTPTVSSIVMNTTTTASIPPVIVTTSVVVTVPGQLAEGSFEAKVVQQAPAYVWRGKGRFSDLADLNRTSNDTIKIQVNGVRTSRTVPALTNSGFTQFTTLN